MIALLLSTLLLAQSTTSFDPVQRFDPTQDVGIDQRLGESVPLDLEFVDEAGRTVRLGEYFEDGPVVLALVYYECPMLCTLVMNGALRTLRAISLDAGTDFQLVTVSIDPREGPELAAEKKDQYLAQYDREGAEEGWHLLTGDEESIRELAEAVGFRYVFDEEADQYAHAGGIVVLTPEGRLSHYFYGVEFPPRDVRLALVEAADGTIGGLADKVLMLCLSYDPTTGRYGWAVMGTIRASGILLVAGIAFFVVRAVRRERKAAPVTVGGS